MCSPYDYVEKKRKRKCVERAESIIESSVRNKDETVLNSITVITDNVIPKADRETSVSSISRKIDASSYIFLLFVILLTLEFFPLTYSAAVIQKIHQNENLVLITRRTLSPKNNLIFNSSDNQNEKENITNNKNNVIYSSSHPVQSNRNVELGLTFTGPNQLDVNCTQPTILDFPKDLISEIPGAILVHIIISLYIFYAIAYLCDAFFVPSIDLICKVLHVSPDVAGCTWMAIATSSPEFFTNIIGTFLTQGEIGVGSIVGSVVFNILAIIAWCGLTAKVALELEYWPVTRDIFFYIVSVLFLIAILWDGQVHWYESLALVLAYCGYITIICNNSRVEKAVENWIWKKSTVTVTSSPLISQESFKAMLICSLSYDGLKSSNEATPLLSDKSGRSILKPQLNESTKSSGNKHRSVESKNIINQLKTHSTKQKQHDSVDSKKNVAMMMEASVEVGLFELPRGHSCLKWFEWIMGWPVRLILQLTVPDCRLLKYANWYPLTFIMCIAYMAFFSYIISWMMTVIGQNLGIADSIMGLTFISVGTSLPEAVSSIIVARQGFGTMGVSNSVGSNTFNILLCLGLPWLLRNIMLTVSGAVDTSISMVSGGFGYISIFLVVSALLLYAVIVWNNYHLDFKIGIFALLLYVVFLILASMLELNMFFPINLPTCKIK